MKRLVLFVIKKYQEKKVVTLPSTCRFIPFCSHYTYQAVDEYGVVRGLFLGAKRILKCNSVSTPCPGTYDPIT